MKKRVVYMLLCFMLCMASIPAAAFADSETPAVPATKWSDKAATAFAGGSGTEADPYQIETPEQLAKLAADINTGIPELDHSREYFKLTKDIDLSAHRWIPIGSGSANGSFHAFSGYFDGNDKTISGLRVDESDDHFSAGLFGNVTGYEIKNLKIKDAYVKTESGDGTENAGILIGSATQGYGMTTSVKDCSVSGIVESGSARTGGLAGYNSYGTYENCTADVKVKGAGKAGGFAGALIETNNFASCSFDVEKNAALKAAGGTEAAEIEGVEAASTQKVKANVCRDYYGKHELKEVPGKAANCLEDGVETYWMCDSCGSMYSDKEQATMITEPVVIKATGHKFGEWKVIKEATASEKGEKQRTCQVCQFVEKAEIPATGAPVNDKSAATGDSSMPILYGILALAALAGAGAVIVTRKKRMN